VLALLYDVHGNLPALEAVLADCQAERYLLGGDYAVAGAWPGETVALLDSLDRAEWIRGNTDRWLVDAHDAPEAAAVLVEKCREALAPEVIDRLAGLRESTTIDGALYCHASPGSDMVSFAEEAQDGEEVLLEGVDAPLVVFGHTHIQFKRRGPGGVWLLNPGSVGTPWDGDHDAAYAVVHDDGRVEGRRAAYDWRAAAKAVREGVGDLPARRIEQARFDPR
jgi:predicted phosphodiesterase